MQPWIETATGQEFWYNSIETDGISIEDIAKSLSKLCRFTGHCSDFYSVAEHSVYVSKLVPKNLALQGLLHDASEAYLSDMASPVKQFMPEYKSIESSIMERIGEYFGLVSPFWKAPEIKEADYRQLKAEAYKLLPSKGTSWEFPQNLKNGYFPKCWNPKKAENEFLKRYIELTDA